MEFNTKYNHGDTVWVITKHMTYKMEDCPTCNNLGRVEINGKKFSCPNCGGYSKQVADEERWELYTYVQCGKIGRITIESYDKKYCKKNDHLPLKVTYMLDTTGVGSGTLWDEKDLFISEEDALLECDKRNKLLKGVQLNV